MFGKNKNGSTLASQKSAKPEPQRTAPASPSIPPARAPNVHLDLPASEFQEQGFQVLFARNPIPMFVYEVQTLDFVDVNQAALALYGYSREEFLGLNLKGIRPPEEVGRLLHSVRDAGETGLRHVGLWKHRTKAGLVLQVEITTQAISLDGRTVVLTAVKDVTGRLEAEEILRTAEAKYRTLVEQLPAITYIAEFGADGRWLYVSPQIESLLGFTPQEWMADRSFWFRQIHPQDREPTLSMEDRAWNSHEPFDFEYRMFARDGRILWFRDRASVVHDPSGKALYLHGVMLDITEAKRAERELTRLSRRTDLILNSAGEGIFGFDVHGKQTFVNEAAARMLGYQPSEILGRDGHQVWHHSKADGSPYPVAECPIFSVFRDGQPHQGSNDVFWRKDGASFPVEFTSTPIREDGQLTGAVVTFRDITKRKESEAALQEAEKKFRSIFENAVEGFFQTTPEGRFLSANPALARMHGYDSPEELLDQVRDIGRQVYVDPARRRDFQRIMEEKGVVERFEYQIVAKNGAKLWFSENARAVRDARGHILYYEGTVEDITERRRSEAERQVSFEIIHGANLTDNLDDLLRLIHRSLCKVLYAENCFVALQDSATGMFHFPFFVDQFDSAPAPQKVGRSCTAYVFRTGRAMLIPQSIFEDLAAQGEVELVGTNSPSWLGVPLRTPAATIGVLVVQHYQKEGAYTERDLEFLASVGGQIALAIERKRAEEALRESEARLRLLVEQLPAVLWTVDTELRFTSSLGSGLARLGLKPNQVVGMSLFEYFQTSDQTFLPIAAHRRAVAGEPVTFHIEWAGGSYACHAEPLRSSTGQPEGAICMALDVTDRKQLEAQLRQAQKMEAVGRLAGGIAHDFNNLLMVIQGYGELLLEGLGATDPLRRNAEQIHQAADRAASLTRQLLAFSRKQVLAPKILNLDAVVSDMEKMLQRLIGEDIRLATLTPPGLWQVKADRSQIEQVILNLAVNARDAMPRGGQLTIETANVELDNAYSHHHAIIAPGEYVMLAVTDTGCGMDLETQAHIFEPFFTTKEKGKGTGLGLATVYGVVKQSGGYVWVYSEPGRGTTLKVYLPRIQEVAAGTEQRREPESPRRGSETILLVEDEKAVRDLAADYLQHTGYAVLSAETSAQALELARHYPQQIHLLLTDVVMPGISGRDLAEQIAVIRHGIKVLYMSGYTDQAIVHHGILEAHTVLLQKPFTLNMLACKLRELLDLQPVK